MYSNIANRYTHKHSSCLVLHNCGDDIGIVEGTFNYVESILRSAGYRRLILMLNRYKYRVYTASCCFFHSFPSDVFCVFDANRFFLSLPPFAHGGCVYVCRLHIVSRFFGFCFKQKCWTRVCVVCCVQRDAIQRQHQQLKLNETKY